MNLIESLLYEASAFFGNGDLPHTDLSIEASCDTWCSVKAIMMWHGVTWWAAIVDLIIDPDTNELCVSEEDLELINCEQCKPCEEIIRPIITIDSTFDEDGTFVSIGEITKPDGSNIPCGECATMRIYDNETWVLLETINTTTWANVLVSDSDASWAYQSVLNYFTVTWDILFPCDWTGIDFVFDKKQYALDNWYSQVLWANGVEMRFEVQVWGTCDWVEDPECPNQSLTASSILCRIVTYAVDNHILSNQVDEPPFPNDFNNATVSGGLITVSPSSFLPNANGFTVGSITTISQHQFAGNPDQLANDLIAYGYSGCSGTNDFLSGSWDIRMGQTGNEVISEITVNWVTSTPNTPIPAIANNNNIIMPEVVAALNATWALWAVAAEQISNDPPYVQCSTNLFAFTVMGWCAPFVMGEIVIRNNPDNWQIAILTPLPSPFYNY